MIPAANAATDRRRRGRGCGALITAELEPESVDVARSAIAGVAQGGGSMTIVCSPLTASIAKITSSAVCSRSSGALASNRRTSVSTPSGISVLASDIAGTGM